MNELEEYIKDAKGQLNCNVSEDYKSNYVTYGYNNEQIDDNLDYFEKCMNNGLSAYKALLFFRDYLNGDYII